MFSILNGAEAKQLMPVIEAPATQAPKTPTPRKKHNKTPCRYIYTVARKIPLKDAFQEAVYKASPLIQRVARTIQLNDNLTMDDFKDCYFGIVSRKNRLNSSSPAEEGLHAIITTITKNGVSRDVYYQADELRHYFREVLQKTGINIATLKDINQDKRMRKSKMARNAEGEDDHSAKEKDNAEENTEENDDSNDNHDEKEGEESHEEDNEGEESQAEDSDEENPEDENPEDDPDEEEEEDEDEEGHDDDDEHGEEEDSEDEVLKRPAPPSKRARTGGR
jgi:hypothetical protein